MGSPSLKATTASKTPEAGKPPNQASRSTLLQALIESMRCETGGEVIVRAGERTGRIYFFRGRVAWVTASSLRSRLTEHLIAKGLANPSDITAVFDECRRQGGNFAEMLVAWGLIDRERMRAEMLEYIARAFGQIVEWGPVATLFVPSSREYRGSLTYSVAELVEATRALAPEESKRLQELVEAIELQSCGQTAPPEVLDASIRGAVIGQLKQLRSAGDCLGTCFVSEKISYSDLDKAISQLGTDSCSRAVAMMLAARDACAKVGLGACSEVTLLGSSTALIVWLVTCEGAGRGLLMVLLGREASLPLARIVVERTLATGPLRQLTPEIGS